MHEQKNNRTILRSLRRKRLNGWINRSDDTDFFVFYGKVKLKVVKKKKISDIPENPYKYFLFEIYTQNKKMNGN